MIYREFGKTGKKCSVIGFGGMRFPNDKKESIRMVQRAVELGINYFDTAPMYCNDKSESIIGKGLEGYKDKVYVSTKSSIGNDPKADDVLKRINKQLKRLKVDRINFYHMWCIMDLDHFNRVIAPGGPYDGAKKAVSEGLVEHILFSMHANGREIEEMVKTGLFDGITVGYNIMNHSDRYKAIKTTHDNNLGVVVMNPLGGGMITRAPDRFNYLVSGPGDTIAKAALRFLLYHPEITVVLCGMGSLKQVEENVSVAEQVLTPDSEKATELRNNINSLGENYCTLCKYCLPCPAGIQIPYYVFAVDRHNLNDPEGAKAWVKFLKRAGQMGESLPSECTECGECIPRCTQNLPIIEKMKEASRLF